MASFRIRRIDCTTGDYRTKLADLRDHSTKDAEIIKSVEKICHDVEKRGLNAVLHYTELYDHAKLTAKTIRVPVEEMAGAYAEADPALLEAVRRIRYNILEFLSGLLQRDALLPVSGSHELQVRYRPLKRVGFYIPGGTASYPSTLLMTICPAQAAGVEELVVATPPSDKGAANKDILAVCHLLGVTEVYRMGGAQAIAAMAYGFDGMPPVDMIVGPGNAYVAYAKKFVYGRVGIDCLAGPSEVVVVADKAANSDYVAVDLIAQAEHTQGISILVAWEEEALDKIETALLKHVKELERGSLARKHLQENGAFVLAEDVEQAIAIVNFLAPEHVHIQTRTPAPETFGERIDNAGAIFLGPYTPVALGDYAAGPSHVLPTGGSARFSSGLNANDFRRRTSILNFTRNGLRDLADDVILMAETEGLPNHAASVQLRLKEITAPIKTSPKKTTEKAKR